MLDDKESAYQAKIILLKDDDDGYAVPQIRRERLTIIWYVTTSENYGYIVSMKKGIDGIISKIYTSINQSKDNSLMIYGREKDCQEISTKNPRKEYMYGLPFSTWSLRILARYIPKEQPGGFYKP